MIQKKQFIIKAKEKLKYLKSKISSYTPSKSFIASIFLILGIGGTLLTQSFAQNKASHNFSDKDLYQDYQIEKLYKQTQEINEFIRNRNEVLFDHYFDPFNEIDNFHKQMATRWSNLDRYFDDIRKSHKPYFNNTSVSHKEDNRYIYYQLNFTNFNKEDVSFNIKDNLLTFAAKKIQKNNSNNKENTIKTKSNFLYSFLIPDGVDLNNPQIIKEDNKIIVKLLKKK